MPYFIAEVWNPRTQTVIESVAPCASMEGAWTWFKGSWRATDGFKVLSVAPYFGGSLGNADPAD